MAQFYDALKDLIDPELISKASVLLDENEADISKAVSSIIPGFLGVILKKGNNAEIRNIFDEAGKLDILSRLKDIVEGKPTYNQQKNGDNFLQQVLGDKASDFTDPIASHAGISKVATNSLVSSLAPVITGFFGEKLVKEGLSLHTILKEIGNEKEQFKGLIPSGIVNSFGLSSLLHANTTLVEDSEDKESVQKSGNGWLKWVALLLALLILFMWWKSCQDKKSEIAVSPIAETETIIETNTSTPTKRTPMEITLPDGMKINAYEGGVEDQIVKFLQSDDYKNATSEELKEKWFKFDNIDFEFGSSTNLKPESKVQIDNIVAILKNFKNDKIDIGAFADRKGDAATNLRISAERAKTISNLLEKSGVGLQVVSAQGFGDQYAKHNVNESDDARAEDRNMALRFVK